MAAGDKEILKAIEEATRRNIETAIAFTNETRALVRELESRIIRLENQMRNKDSELQQLRNMITQLQAIIFAGGTT